MTGRPRVVVVGGGITGLACAYALRDRAEVTVFEATSRVGGNLVTERRDGFVLDGGPDSWVAAKPSATALAKEVGLESELIGTRPETRRVYVVYQRKLHPLPQGLVLGVPTRFGPMVTTGLFSWFAKFRMGLEPLIPKRRSETDESVFDFIVRRLGRDAGERLAGPLLGGIFAGDPSKLSIRAAFPQLYEMEQEHGSLVMAMRAARRNRGAVAASAFLSLTRGIASLPEALDARLGDRVKKNAAVARVEAGAPWRVWLVSGETFDADHVVLSVPQRILPGLLRGVAADAAAHIERIRLGSSATVFLAYERSQVSHALDAVGFIVPRRERTRVIASTWVSSKWSHRAPQDKVLLRAFLGGIGQEEVLRGSDEDLVDIVREELPMLMGEICGEPLFSRVFRWARASPQPEVGHLELMNAAHAALARHPGLHIAGNGYDGTGIPDCIKQGEGVAAAIMAVAQNAAGSV